MTQAIDFLKFPIWSDKEGKLCLILHQLGAWNAQNLPANALKLAALEMVVEFWKHNLRCDFISAPSHFSFADTTAQLLLPEVFWPMIQDPEKPGLHMKLSARELDCT
jgi:hypothetical protein